MAASRWKTLAFLGGLGAGIAGVAAGVAAAANDASSVDAPPVAAVDVPVFTGGSGDAPQRPVSIGDIIAQGTKNADGSCHFDQANSPSIAVGDPTEESAMAGEHGIDMSGMTIDAKVDTDENCTTRFVGVEVRPATEEELGRMGRAK